MGYYINPINCPKEVFLVAHGIQVRKEDFLNFDFGNEPTKIPVILVNNGPFTAAGICFSSEEMEAFTQETDPRSKIYFILPRKVLDEEAGVDKHQQKAISIGKYA